METKSDTAQTMKTRMDNWLRSGALILGGLLVCADAHLLEVTHADDVFRSAPGRTQRGHEHRDEDADDGDDDQHLDQGESVLVLARVLGPEVHRDVPQIG